MLKNLLIGILAITAALAVSALTWDSLHESNEALAAKSKALVVADKGERDSLPSASIAVPGFRTPPASDALPSITTASGVKAPHYYEYGPAILATGIKGPHFYEYGPAILATGVKGPHFYEYGPAILATGFAKPQ